MIKYRAQFEEIKAFEVIKETAKQLTYIEHARDGKPFSRTERKESSYTSWHDTWEEARIALLAEAVNKYQACEKRLHDLFQEMQNIKEMENPDSKKAAP